VRIVIYECEQHLAIEKRGWIQNDLKIQIFKEDIHVRDFPSDDVHRFFLIVMNDEDLSALTLSYPVGTFKIL
jgi:hypothetical protein